MKSPWIAVLLPAVLAAIAPPVAAQAFSAPKCPPQVNPVRNKEIKVYVTTHLAAPSNNGIIWSLNASELLFTHLNRAGAIDGNRFVKVGRPDSSNVDIDLSVDNTTDAMVYTLKMTSWNSLEVQFATPSKDLLDPIEPLVGKIYEYFHLGYQAGPDACRPWIK